MRNEFKSDGIPILLVGSPESKRGNALLEGAQIAGFRPRLISYSDSLDPVAGRESLQRGGVVRLDSPSESLESFRAILKAGIGPMQELRKRPLGEGDIDQLTPQRGEILYPLQWYLGFRSLLGQLSAWWGTDGIDWMSSPAEVSNTFDKQSCCEKWQSRGIPVPVEYPGIESYAALREAIRDRHVRLFIKLRYGYSAMGAVALEWREGMVRAITTVETTWSGGRSRLFVTKTPRTLRREFEIAWLIDTLAQEEIVVQEWLPKARIRGVPFDLRIVTIGGEPKHLIGRASSSPFTNLNLDSSRVPEEEIRGLLGDSFEEILQGTRDAAAAFPDAFSLGIDVLVRTDKKRFAVLEANAFGDYLPGLLYEGMSTYHAEFAAYAKEMEVVH